MTLVDLLPTLKLRTMFTYAVGVAFWVTFAGAFREQAPLALVSDFVGDVGVDATWPEAAAAWLDQRRAVAGPIALLWLVGGLGIAAGEGSDDGLYRPRAALTGLAAMTALIQLEPGALGTVIVISILAMMGGATIGWLFGQGRVLDLVIVAVAKVTMIVLQAALLPIAVLFGHWPASEDSKPRHSGMADLEATT